MDVTTTKMLSIHIDALLPPTSAELDLPHSAQVAAILGVGLVYQGTAQRRITEVLLSEIGDSLRHYLTWREGPRNISAIFLVGLFGGNFN